jgi:hypothetical protein
VDIGDRYWRTADAIAAIHPKTIDGLQMKALVALDMLSKGQRKLDKIGVKGFSMWGGCVSIVKDGCGEFRHERRPQPHRAGPRRIRRETSERTSKPSPGSW